MSKVSGFRGVGQREFKRQLYWNPAEIETALDQLARQYPDLCSVHRWGLATPELGKQPQALWLGKNRNPGRPTLLLLGGVHAREWVPPNALLALACDLLECKATESDLAYGRYQFTHGRIAEMLEAVNWLIVPVINPDGVVWAQTVDPMWRKNRAQIVSSTFCSIGVDINRNFPFLWDWQKTFPGRTADELKISTHPPDDTYRGTELQVETQNVISLLDQFPGVGWAVDVHSAVRWVMYPWSFEDTQTRYPEMAYHKGPDFLRGIIDGQVDQFDPSADYREYMPREDLGMFEDLGRTMSELAAIHADSLPYKLTSSARADYGGLQVILGSTDDYCYSRHLENPALPKIFSYTFECGEGADFSPTLEQRTRLIQEACSAFVGLGLRIVKIMCPD